MSGRKHCSHCKRWRHCIDFSVKFWLDKQKTVPRKLQSYCKVCQRIAGRERRQHMTPAQKKIVRATARVHQRRLRREQGIKERPGGAYIKTGKRDGSVAIGPFRRWLEARLEEMPIGELSDRIRMDPALILSYVKGYDKKGKHAKKTRSARKLRAIDWVALETVDKALINWGEPWVLDELYPIDRSDQAAA